MKVKNRKHLKALIKKRDKEEVKLSKNFGKMNFEDKLFAK